MRLWCCDRHQGGVGPACAGCVAERETIARVVAWLRSEATRHRERNESWQTPTTDAVVAAYADIHADAIERGDWCEGGQGR